MGVYVIVVINAGGSGTRLWPLSTPDYPKHLLKISGDKSLLQLAYLRAKELSDHIYIVTELSHVEHVKQQLPELSDDHFVVEPARRGTAGCVLAGLHKVRANHDTDEPVAFLNADHVINDVQGFAYSFKKAAEASKQQGRITLIGIEPTGPSTGFGYIEKGNTVAGEALVYNVGGFEEKPDLETAQRYIKSGRYLWNGGYFVGSVNVFQNALEKFAPKWAEYYQRLATTTDDSSYKETYLSFEADALDYALMERDKELLVVPANFDWLDVGSFTDVHKAIGTDKIGNHLDSQKIAIIDVENTMVINQEPEKPIALIGLDNVVVINTPHGLLITRKDQDQKVKEVVNKLKEQDA